MGEEAFDEVVVVGDRTLVVRGGYGREEVFLGVEDDRIVVRLGRVQQDKLIDVICAMRASVYRHCWWCEELIELPRLDEIAECRCGATHAVIAEGDVLELKPLQCGHHVPVAEHCERCE